MLGTRARATPSEKGLEPDTAVCGCTGYSIPFYPPAASKPHAAARAPSWSYSIPFYPPAASKPHAAVRAPSESHSIHFYAQRCPEEGAGTAGSLAAILSPFYPDRPGRHEGRPQPFPTFGFSLGR